jgi:hypothetical protein
MMGKPEVIHLAGKRAFRRSDPFGVPLEASREIAPGLAANMNPSRPTSELQITKELRAVCI